MEFLKCYPGGKTKSLTLSYDDGVWPDRKLVALMRAHGVSGTFNLNSVRRPVPGRVDAEGNRDFRMEPEEIGDLYEGFEIGAHSCTHPHLEGLSGRELYQELYLDKQNLEQRYRQKIVGLALPFGTHDEKVDEAVKKLGFLYCRTVKSTHSFDVPAHLPMLDATCRHREPELMDVLEQFLKTDQELALFYLWGHSFEFELADNWKIMENFLDRASGHDEVFYGTNGQIITYLKAMENLVSGEDFFLNPTDTDLWVRVEGRPLCIPAGQWVDLPKTKI